MSLFPRRGSPFPEDRGGCRAANAHLALEFRDVDTVECDVHVSE